MAVTANRLDVKGHFLVRIELSMFKYSSALRSLNKLEMSSFRCNIEHRFPYELKRYLKAVLGKKVLSGDS